MPEKRIRGSRFYRERMLQLKRHSDFVGRGREQLKSRGVCFEFRVCTGLLTKRMLFPAFSRVYAKYGGKLGISLDYRDRAVLLTDFQTVNTFLCELYPLLGKQDRCYLLQRFYNQPIAFVLHLLSSTFFLCSLIARLTRGSLSSLPIFTQFGKEITQL